MPTLLDLILHPVSLAFFGIYAALMLWEWLAPARPLPRMAGWHWRGMLSFVVYFLLASYLPLLWTQYLLPLQWFDLSRLGTLTGGLVGLLVLHGTAYAWHRVIHGNGWLWRWFHQMHHSAERIDTYSAFWFSPVEVVGWTAAGSFALTIVIGLNAEAATVANLASATLVMFTHTNVRTPRWLGYLVERPENHSWHHGRGHHRDNYSELPVFDMLFGTFRNENDFAPQSGFYDGASRRVLEMVLGREVGTPRA